MFYIFLGKIIFPFVLYTNHEKYDVHIIKLFVYKSMIKNYKLKMRKRILINQFYEIHNLMLYNIDKSMKYR